MATTWSMIRVTTEVHSRLLEVCEELKRLSHVGGRRTSRGCRVCYAMTDVLEYLLTKAGHGPEEANGRPQAGPA
jgi:hypothetical protein